MGNQHHTVLLPQKTSIPDTFIKRDMKVVTLGDSLTEGVGDTSNQGGYTSIVREHLENQKGIVNVEINNFGVKGYKTEDLLKRLENEIAVDEISQADTIIVTIGANDLMSVVRENILSLSFEIFEKELVQYQDRLEKIFDYITTYNKNADVFLVGIYNPFISLVEITPEVEHIIENWNNGSRTIIGQYDNITFIPVYDLFQNQEESLLFKDNFHPNTKGYELIGERIIDNM